MRVHSRGILMGALEIAFLVILFSLVQSEVNELRRDLQGSANGLAEAQSRQARDLSETRRLIRTALEDSNLQFSQARKIILESSEMLKDERQEITRLIENRAGKIESTLASRLESERDLLKKERAGAEAAAAARKQGGTPERDAFAMKRKMIYPTVQLRGEGTVGSGVLVYSEPQGDERSGAVSFILTAHHVVLEVTGSNSSRGVVEDIRAIAQDDAFDPEVFKAELVLFDRDRDAALLRILSDRRFPDVAEFAPRETLRRIDIYTPAYAVGCPLGNRPLPTVGEVSTKSKVVGDQVFWMLNAPTFFGNSGGGIFLGSTCQLIGISSMIYTYGKSAPAVVPHMGLFVPLETLYDWLDSQGHSFIYRREPVPKGLLERYGIRKTRRVAGGGESGPRPGSGTTAAAR